MREEMRMDFNTGSSSGRSPTPGGTRGPTAGGAGGEFNLSDPVGIFISTVQRAVLEPVDFFRGIARRGDLTSPLVFALICYEIYTLFAGLLALVEVSGTSEGVGAFIVSLILAPIFAAIGLFIGAGILHLLVLLLIKPSNAGFEATFRVTSYSSVTTLVSWIPIIGLIANLYGLYLAIVGIREVHGTTTGRAALVVLIPAAVVILLILVFVSLVGAALFFSAQPPRT